MRRDVLVVAHSYFPSDPRIRKEVDALLGAGRSVDVVCLRGPGEAPREWRGALRVRRLPVARHRGSGLATYALEYAAFMALALVAVTATWLRSRHRVVQAHTLPDPLILTGVVPRALGARLVLDMHELTPEFFETRTGLGPRHPAIRLLRVLERLSCRFAHRVITVSEPVAERLVERGVPRDKIAIVMNTAPFPDDPGAPVSPDPGSHPGTHPGDTDAFTLVYAGLLSDLYDLGTVLRALALLRAKGHRDIRVRLVGDGTGLPALRREAEELGIEGQVVFEGRVAPDRVPALLESAAVAVVPLAGVGYMEFALPTKLFESLAAGLPVLTTRLRTVRHYFPGDALCYVEPGDAEEMAGRVLELRNDPAARRRFAERGAAVARGLRWESQAAAYLGVVAELAGEAAPETA